MSEDSETDIFSTPQKLDQHFARSVVKFIDALLHLGTVALGLSLSIHYFLNLLLSGRVRCNKKKLRNRYCNDDNSTAHDGGSPVFFTDPYFYPSLGDRHCDSRCGYHV